MPIACDTAIALTTDKYISRWLEHSVLDADLNCPGECTTLWRKSGKGGNPLDCSLREAIAFGVLGRLEEIQ